MNHIQIVGDSLYVGIGVRTRNGAFETFSGDMHGESAYGGSLAVIDDLNQVASEPNAAGLYPANPDLQTYRQLIQGEHPDSALPLTSTADNKLRIHSNGTRNPFGLAIDGEGVPWISVNWQRTENHVYDRENIDNAEGDAFGEDGFQDDVYDQLFKTSAKADYGYRNGNWQHDAMANASGFFLPENRVASFTFDNYADPAVVTDRDDLDPAYNQDYAPDSSPGLGPSSSANGFDFYQSNAFPFALHKDAFVARWNGMIDDGGDSITYRDVVSVDSTTGEVNRVAAGFRNPLDVIADGHGNLLVADYGGSIYRISAKDPVVGYHPFAWDSDEDGNWSDRLAWNAESLPESERMVPHEWGDARYVVTIDRPRASPTVMLDQDATIERLQLWEELVLEKDATLTVADQIELRLSESVIAGNGTILGIVNNTNGGTVSPGDTVAPIGKLTVSTYQQGHGQFAVQVDADGNADQLVVTDGATINGTLSVEVPEELTAAMQRGQTREYRILDTGSSSLSGRFLTQRTNGAFGDTQLGYGLFAYPKYDDHGVTLQVLKAVAGDANGDGEFNSGDFVSIFANGEYEDTIEDNSGWREGDWDGDMDFNSSDLVVAFQAGGYVGRTASTVPEPSGIAGILWAVVLFKRFGARRQGRSHPKN